MYADVGRPSIPPERLLKASLLIALFSVRSERAFCEELDYKLLFRWFLGMQLMERSFDATVFTKNRLRLLEHQVGQQLFDEVVLAADRRAPAGSPRTWRNTRAGAPALSMDARPAIAAMRSVSV